MDLHVTLAAGPGVRLPGGETTEEIVIVGAHLASGEQLHDQLEKRTGAHHHFVKGKPLRELEPGVPPLTSGAVIIAAASARMAPSPSRPGSLFFLVRSGPDAGKAVPLARGTYTIGRSAADITIHDPELSRVHAGLTVTNDSLILRDRNSANGVWVDGHRVELTRVTTDSDIRIGTSQCALVLPDTPAQPPLAADLSEPLDISAPPPQEVNRLLLLTAFLPLALGVVLAVTTGMWFFLAFSALSAVTGLVPLITGRRKRRAFSTAVTAAVNADSERRRRAAPEPGRLTRTMLRPELTAAGEATPLLTDGRYLRLGVADQPANVRPKPEPPEWQLPVIAKAPVLVPLAEPESGEPVNLHLRGPEEVLMRVAHLLLLQLSTLLESGEILCYGRASDLPVAARFLPRVTLVAHRARLVELLASGRYTSLVLFGTEPVPDTPRLRIYRFSSSTESEEERWTADYFPSAPVLRTPDGVISFRPDYVRTETFNVLARSIGTRADPDAEDGRDTSVPEAIALPDLLPCDAATIGERWRESSNKARVRTVIGSSAAGPLVLDLVADGPHLLIAGTTGSGKSEFLRTLVLGLALNCSPADLNLLFIDFKGGSGLGPLARLPHATGMLTDLSAAAVSRALFSLRAEIKRREAMFADIGASDYLEYRQRTSIQLPRLVTVIDEFRMLSEEIPGSVHELMRIATLGRSLGMHLVLATQRPQGAITSEIRANITTSVALRMQSVMESQDVLESAAASSIPVGLPGRGYLRIGSGRAIEFQTATTTRHAMATPSTSITSFTSLLTRKSRSDSSMRSARESSEKVPADATNGIPAMVDSANSAAQALPLPVRRAPVCPPLPSTLARAEGPADIPQLGLLDIPEKQLQRPLVWEPAHHSHLALLGQPGSGLRSALTHVVTEHLRAAPDRHLYLLDGDSSLRAVMEPPQVGAYVTASEVKRAARVLQRISELVADRLNNADELPGEVQPLTVLVSGWGRWATAFRSGRFAWAEDALQDIVRDGEAAGITLVIAGDRELIASRFFSMLPNRLYLPLGASPETLLSWPKLPAMDAISGRAFVQGRISTDAEAVAQLVTEASPVPYVQPAQRPFPVAGLPRAVSDRELKPASSGSRTLRVPVGLGGDDLATVYLPLPQRTPALIVGVPGTGKSETLDLIAQLAPPSLKCRRPLRNEDPEAFWKLAAAAGAGSDHLLLVDDADLLPRDTHQRLAAMLAAGARAVFASSPSPSVPTSPALATLRINPLGIVLGPRSPTDGDVFGLRLDVDGTPPPGRGILIEARHTVEIQIAKAGDIEPGGDLRSQTA